MKARRTTTAVAVTAAALAGLVLPTPGAASAAACTAPSRVTLARTSVVATAPVAGRVYLTCKVAHAVRVTLTGSGLAVPASVVVPARKPGAAFTARTLPSTTTTNASVTAKASGVSRKATVRVTPGCASHLGKLSMPETGYALQKLSGTVSIACAPLSAVTVALSSKDPDAKVPATVTIPAGKTSAKIPLTLARHGDRRITMFAAKYAGATAYDSTTITPTIALVEFLGDDDINVPLTGCVDFPHDVVVSISTNNPALTFASTAHLNGCGGDISATQVQSVPVDTLVTVRVQLGPRVLTATTKLLGPYQSGEGFKVVTDDLGPYIGLSPRNLTLKAGLQHPAPAGGLDVTWTIRDASPALARVEAPEVDRIEEGGLTSAATYSLADVTQTTVAVVDVTISGETVSFPVTLEPRMVSLTLPAHVDSDVPFTATVVMKGPSTTDQVIYLGAPQGSTTVPETVTLPAGQTQVQFSATVHASDPSDPDGSPYRNISARRLDSDFLDPVEQIDGSGIQINP